LQRGIARIRIVLLPAPRERRTDDLAADIHVAVEISRHKAFEAQARG